MKIQTYLKYTTCLLLALATGFSNNAVGQEILNSGEWSETECETTQCSEDMQRLVRFSLNGSPDAQVIVALAYANGEGVEQDLDLARQHLKRALRNNDPRAWYIFSNWLKKGISVEVDLVEAEYAFQRALRQDHPVALFEQAVRNLNLDGGDNQEVIHWLERAAKQNHQPAQYLLAQLLAAGIGVPADVDRAALLLGQLSRFNYKQSRERLAVLLESEAIQEQTVAALESESSPYENVERISVSGMRITMESYIGELASTLDTMRIYDGVSTGTNIRGQVCGQGVAQCSVVYSADTNSPAATALGALTGSAGF
ncbi:hypothetical protein C9940_04625 [Pseudidiomarina aestuarii]|uniref:Uncharacterized protein n=1 Tax=Pseudidiomarina aestuarii TaxID=624146 RepID=A0A2T4CWE5_9GAMM|nr:hypothetical protein C9988_02990 [Pseudidiomarina aestuarii]PTB85879.1 hypothetical protein C9940_04625 [Pseudidiomarina aestuarii]